MRTTNDFPRAWLNQIMLVGNTPATALRLDPRFSYSLYVPDAHYLPTPDAPKLPLVVNVHGTRREHLAARDALRPLADDKNTACAVLAPLFPAGITGDDDLGSYKQVIADARQDEPSTKTLRYDQILLSMVEQVAQRYPGIETSRFMLAGFSGGAKFVHRFFYLHPDRLSAVSVGAPGGTTLFGQRLSIFEQMTSLIDYNTEELLKNTDPSPYQHVELQIMVGDKDVETEQFAIATKLTGERYDERTRVDKAGELFEDWTDHGLNVRLDVVPGVAHVSEGCSAALRAFLGERLQALT